MSEILQSNIPVKTEDITRSRPETPEPDERAKQEMALYDHQYRTQKAELGLVGKFLGCNAEKPGNISSIAIAAAFGIIIMGGFYLQQYFKEILTACASIISLSLGYLFGSHKSSS